MPKFEPSPKSWTIRFKHRKLTVFVHADPLHTLSTLKNELFKAIRETRPDGKLCDKPIPTSPELIYFAKPIDPEDWKQGWTRLEDPGLEALGIDGDLDGAASTKSAGRSRWKGKGKVSDVTAESIKSLGLRDNSVLAFKWKLSEDADFASDDAMTIEDEDDWDLDFITYEDLFAEEEE